MLIVNWGAISRRWLCFSFVVVVLLGTSLAASAQDTPLAEKSDGLNPTQPDSIESDVEPANSQGEPAAEVPPIEVTQPAQTKPAKPKPVAAKPASPSGRAYSRPYTPSQPILDVTSATEAYGETGGADRDSYLAATGPVDGYVATSSATATKTGTPLIETPQSISVITADQMEAQAVENLAQALRYTPGVTGELFGLDNRCYGTMIRGFSGIDDTSYYRDSLQLKGAAFASFCTLDPYGAERIEVLRGPASVLYGQGEPGGIINYVSKRPTDKPFHEVELAYGNYNHYEGRFDLSDKVTQNGKLKYRLTGVGIDSDTQIDHVDYDRFFVAPSFTWQPNADTTLTILTNYQYDDTGWTIQFYPAEGTLFRNPNGKIHSNRFTGEPDFDYYKNTQYSAGYLFEHNLTEAMTVRQNLRYAHLDNSQRGVFGFGLDPDKRTYNRYGDGGESEVNAWNVDNQLQTKVSTGPLAHTFLLGLDYQNYRLSDKGLAFDGPSLAIDIFDPVYGEPLTFVGLYQDTDVKLTQTGVYLQDQISLNDKWFLQLGGRRDFARSNTLDHRSSSTTRQADEATTGRAGLVHLFDNGFAPYASYSESFAPTLDTDIFGNPFAPETGQQYEAGIKYEPLWMKNALITFSAFDLTKQNVLTSDPNDPLNQIQTGEINSRGLEFETVASLDWGLDLRAAYTYLDVEIAASNDGTQGNTPYGVPTHSASLWADYTMQRGQLAGFGFGGGVRYVGETWGDDANTFKVPSVTLFDAVIHYDWNSFRFALNAQNVFDKEYIASCFAFEFGCFYGERRQVLGSLRYRW